MTAQIKDWSQAKRRIQERWPGLPDEDIEASQGDRTALVALLEGRLGYARPNAEEDVDEILAGEVIVPEDVADERTHTGTSGPVGPQSSATDFATTDEERAELPQQPPDESSPFGAPQSGAPGGAAPQSMYGEGGPPMGGGDRDRWGRDPWEAMDGGRRKMAPIPMMVVAIVGVTGAVLLIRMLARKRSQRNQSKTEQVAEQARHLLEEIAERMPSAEELRDRVRSLDELREKRMKTRVARR